MTEITLPLEERTFASDEARGASGGAKPPEQHSELGKADAVPAGPPLEVEPVPRSPAR